MKWNKFIRSSLKIGLFVALVSGFAYSWWLLRRGWTVSELERQIQTGLRANADRMEVEAWLQDRGIQHGFFEDVAIAKYGDQTAPSLVGLREDQLGGMVVGMLDGKEVRAGLFEIGRIRIYFFLDRKGRMVGHLVHRVSLSL